MESSSGSSNATGKRPVRRDPEARKAQNRAASRNYREKRRMKLALLDQILQTDGDAQAPTSSSAGDNKGKQPLEEDAEPVADAFRHQEGRENAPGEGQSLMSQWELPAPTTMDIQTDRTLLSAITDHGWASALGVPDSNAMMSAADPFISSSQYLSGSEPHRGSSALFGAQFPTQEISFDAVAPFSEPFQIQDLELPSFETENHQNPAQSSLPPTSTSGSSSDTSLLPILEGLHNLSLTQKEDLISLLQSQVRSSATSSAPPPPPPEPSASSAGSSTDIKSSNQPPPPPFSNWIARGPFVGRPRTRLQREARHFADFLDRQTVRNRKRIQNPSSSSDATDADETWRDGSTPAHLLSRMYVAEAGYFGAIFANCHALGMDQVEPMMEENGVSPFCIGSDTGYDPRQLVMVKKRFDGLVPDLRPLDDQLLFGHHPYIDTLPFKTFRYNCLKALQREPPFFDEEELCGDLQQGMICWGAQNNSLGMEAGVPWDARSWEPRIWFLKKYWYLVGGWDDELWRLVRWWHGVRGEKIQYY